MNYLTIKSYQQAFEELISPDFNNGESITAWVVDFSDAQAKALGNNSACKKLRVVMSISYGLHTN